METYGRYVIQVPRRGVNDHWQRFRVHPSARLVPLFSCPELRRQPLPPDEAPVKGGRERPSAASLAQRGRHTHALGHALCHVEGCPGPGRQAEPPRQPPEDSHVRGQEARVRHGSQKHAASLERAPRGVRGEDRPGRVAAVGARGASRQEGAGAARAPRGQRHRPGRGPADDRARGRRRRGGERPRRAGAAAPAGRAPGEHEGRHRRGAGQGVRGRACGGGEVGQGPRAEAPPHVPRERERGVAG
mmetsp:Transcript_156/g.473  ORF Transcript_156/g.473 Transcript_156/m.473 type:complete len:245 (-) Transcript_156:532-1266(-)